MTALCRASDGVRPCPFVHLCEETRQRIAHYAPHGSIRGMACYAYQHYADVHPGLLQPPSEETLEREALMWEGNA